jgi:hypothetical protein
VRIPPRGRGFFKTSGSTDPMWSLEEHGVEASIAITWDQQKAMNVAGPFFYAVACYLTSIVDAEVAGSSLDTCESGLVRRALSLGA